MGKMSKPRVSYEGSGQELPPNTADCLSTNNSTLLLSLHSHSEAAPSKYPCPTPQLWMATRQSLACGITWWVAWSLGNAVCRRREKNRWYTKELLASPSSSNCSVSTKITSQLKPTSNLTEYVLQKWSTPSWLHEKHSFSPY